MGAVATTASALPRTVQGIPYRVPLRETSGQRSNPEPIPSEADFDFSKIKFWAGEGSNRSAVILQWTEDDEVSALVFGYRWDGSKCGYDAILSIVKTYPTLYGSFTEGGTYGSVVNSSGSVIYPDANGLLDGSAAGFDGAKATQPDDWFHGGWFEGYWSYWTGMSGDETLEYSNVGCSSRMLEDGSIDAWIFSPDMSRTLLKPWEAAPSPDGGETDDSIFSVNGLFYRITGQQTAALTAPLKSIAGYNAYQELSVSIPSSVSHADINYSVTTIDQFAFRSAKTTSVSIPESVQEIGSGAFLCGLTNLSVAATQPPLCKSNTFASDAASVLNVSVPASAIEAYKKADVWKDLRLSSVTKGDVVEVNGVKYRITAEGTTNEAVVTFNAVKSPDDYFSNKDYYVGDYDIPATIGVSGKTFDVVGLDDNCFYQASKLGKVSLPESVRRIGELAFYRSSLSEINIPAKVDSIAEYTFFQCKSLHTVRGMEGVKDIGKQSFMMCDKLATIGDLRSLEKIHEFAFNSDSTLTELPDMPNLKCIEHRAFGVCHGLRKIVLPATIEDFGIDEILGNNHKGDIKIYFCGNRPVDVMGIYIFATSWEYETGMTQPAVTYAPIYVPFGSRMYFKNVSPWNLSQILELTPIASVKNHDFSVDGRSVSFNASITLDDGIVETDVPQSFIDANDFSTHPAKIASTMRLEYRKVSETRAAPEIFSIAASAEGTDVSARISNALPGKYEYRWTTDAEGQNATTPWTEFTIAGETEDVPLEALFNFTDVATLNPAPPAPTSWSNGYYYIDGIEYENNGVTLVANQRDPGKPSYLYYRSYYKSTQGCFFKLKISAPAGTYLKRIYFDCNPSFSAPTGFRLDAGMAGTLDRSTQKPYWVEWNSDPENPTSELSFTHISSALWCDTINVELERVDDGPAVGVGTIESDKADVEYYTLQGIKVAAPTEGIYIERRGNQTRKVMIRR